MRKHYDVYSGNLNAANNFVSLSLEIHLFFGRIMKEHSFFLQAGFLPPDAALAKKAARYREEFEEFLWQIVRISNGIVSGEVLRSGEVVTEYTEMAEESTSRLTGIPIDQRITQAEKALRASGGRMWMDWGMSQTVRRLNERAIELTEGLIALKEEILARVNRCQSFTVNYPLLIEHIIREAKLYCQMIRELNENGCLAQQDMRSMEAFWNQIMMEHALFIRGLLDPSEEELIMAADGFAQDYRKLLEEAKRKDCETIDLLTRQTLEETIKYRDFKAAGAKGITECEISSIILPLLADHVLREANHYLRILKSGE